MGIVDTFDRSNKDLEKPHKKSYWQFLPQINLVDIADIREKSKLMPSEQRALFHEFSEKEPIDKVVVIDNENKKLGKFTTYQIKEILSDIGFNVDPWFSKKHYADFEAVMNIGGFTVPGWVRMARIITKILPSHQKIFLSRLSPGKDRLHLRVFENNDGTWIISAHTEHNWLSLNLPKVYKAHVGYGAGDYVTGTIMFYRLINKFKQALLKNRTISFEEVQKVINKAYKQSLEEKLRMSFSLENKELISST